ncbi:MAG: DUF721 domain-containing protein [Gemmatimonadota bacterium]|nr:DUF721 domain-containing protein [Gemmatimonadota bacterium]MDP6802603.1 DUF721 domain-containing protein [Gemmatimonadota bacterium]MDP7030728.1 DUF721 domain-containing protein [Gemmatimonadota bacterium]
MKRVGEVLEVLGEAGALGRRFAETRALEAWTECVGRGIAERTRPLRVAGGRLIVVAEGAALRQELVFHRKNILEKFNKAAGRVVARELVFLEGDASESPHPEPLRPVVRSTAETEGIAEDLAEEPRTVPMFDADAHRKQLRRIARESDKARRERDGGSESATGRIPPKVEENC